MVHATIALLRRPEIGRGRCWRRKSLLWSLRDAFTNRQADDANMAIGSMTSTMYPAMVRSHCTRWSASLSGRGASIGGLCIPPLSAPRLPGPMYARTASTPRVPRASAEARTVADACRRRAGLDRAGPSHPALGHSNRARSRPRRGRTKRSRTVMARTTRSRDSRDDPIHPPT